MDTRIEWTLTAQRETAGLSPDEAALAAALGPWAQVGDVIECAHARGARSFVVHARRIVVSREGAATLWLMLDYPAHGARAR